MEEWNTHTGKPDEQTDEVRNLFENLLERDEQRRVGAPAPAEEYQSTPAPQEPVTEETEQTSVQQDAVYILPDYSDIPLIMPEDEEDEHSIADWLVEEYEEEELPTPPTERRNPLKIFWDGFRANLPRKGDRGTELVRKLAFLLALVVLLSSVGYILYDMVLQPAANSSMYGDLAEDYNPDDDQPVFSGNYPQGMLGAFRSLYDQNPEVRGWLTYHTSSGRDFLNIDYPVMYSGDNDKYLTIDFHEKKNKNGALFFDMRNTIEANNYSNKALIIYGHNMASGQMFAGLNKFIGNVNNARAAATMTLSTLFEEDQYKVFAVVMTDEDATGGDYFNTRRTQFSTNGDFIEYIDAVRARSLFDYPVDVIPGDQLLVLSTCTSPSTAKIKDGRLVVFARKVRSGEYQAVDLAGIVKNEDVIMPRAWYEKQKLDVHPYYENGNYQPDGSTVTPTVPGMSGVTDSIGMNTTDTTGTDTTNVTGTGDEIVTPTATGGGTVAGGSSATTTAGGATGSKTTAAATGKGTTTGGTASNDSKTTAAAATTAPTASDTPEGTTTAATTQADGDSATTTAPAADTTAAPTDSTQAGTDDTDGADGTDPTEAANP